MARDSRDIEYRFILTDNVTESAEKATGAEREMKKSVEDTQTAVKNSDISLLKSLTVMAALKESVTGVTNELRVLGIVSDAQYQSLRKVAAGFSLLVDSARAVKAVISVMETLKATEFGLAAIETYRSVLNNPAMAGVAIGAAGIAGGIGGFLIAGGGKTITQNISFGSRSEDIHTRSGQRTAMEAAGG
jgi:hypothetical protein